MLMAIYQRLLAHYGPQHWWPAEGPFEVIVGAILTQSAAWSNVEKAIASLKAAGVLSPQEIRKIDTRELAALIYSCGYYNVKAAKLKEFCSWFADNYQDDPAALSECDPASLRAQLLSVRGIGEETADSILLYAANHPVFVIDAYTRRIISRLGLLAQGQEYSDFQGFFMSNLNGEAYLYNEYHALLVALAKDCCRKVPRCTECCLRELCQLSSVPGIV
jgi:endonuclease III related protein